MPENRKSRGCLLLPAPGVLLHIARIRSVASFPDVAPARTSASAPATAPGMLPLPPGARTPAPHHRRSGLQLCPLAPSSAATGSPRDRKHNAGRCSPAEARSLPLAASPPLSPTTSLLPTLP